MSRPFVTIDGNEAAAYTAFRTNEVIAIYPITPSSPMGEHADAWAVQDLKNVWGTVPQVTEMQAEGGAAGAVHGALQGGALTTTFTASQGLLLMIPNMFKIAGELTSTVFHVSARSVATHALSIFCDHSDVMAARSTGFAILASNSIQEVMDFALIAQAATLEARVPFIHFFDGFRTSHEVSKVEQLSEDDMRAMIDNELIRAHRQRSLSPDRPVIRGTAQNPDVFFQARETVNPYYVACPDIVQKAMDKFSKIVGRHYHLFDYTGAPEAEKVIILMGSGADTVQETVAYLQAKGEKVGVLKVHLYRPFSVKHFIDSLPESVKHIAVLDRTKEPGSMGEPLYQDVITALVEAKMQGLFKFKIDPTVTGGRYGLSSKEFTPAMVKGVFDSMNQTKLKNHFTIGINDDVTKTSLEYNPEFVVEPEGRTRAVFFGLGSDGTVSANKNSIKIIGEETKNYAQGYFVYDSKKAGSLTVSHLRFGPEPIQSPYLISKANFVACHQFSFLEKYEMLKLAEEGATFLLNSIFSAETVWDHLPRKVQQQIIDKKLKFFVIDAYKLADEVGLGVRINTIMQTCFFAISNVLPKAQAIDLIKKFTEKAYGKRGESIIKMNFKAIDEALNHLIEVQVPKQASSNIKMRKAVPDEAPEYIRNVTGEIVAGRGDDLPVSAFAPDGSFPTATTQWEKRNVALQVPVWDPEVCIQCGKCVFVCPHAVIRSKVYDSESLKNAPDTFKSTDAKWKQYAGKKYTIQISAEDCTGCGVCVSNCPARSKDEPDKKAINMNDLDPIRERERQNWKFFQTLPYVDRKELKLNLVKDIQLLQPLFEFSGACAGCGETAYIKLMTQLFGDRALIANATGCSSIYGGNLPTTPYAQNPSGRGPSWSNSLFEDNAEFGMGMRLALDKQLEYSKELVKKLSKDIGKDLVNDILNADQTTDDGIEDQRTRIKTMKKKLQALKGNDARELISLADVLVKKSVWIIGGDGWAYDIGYGGLDHVIASGRNVNILVLDTEVYSNTGGQASKATPRGATAKFAMGGKPVPKKDLAMMAITYGNVYVARVALGASDVQTVKAFREAEAYNGPSLILAYCHCIAHGYDLIKGLEQQKLAVKSGYWPLVRYNPDLLKEGKNPLTLDSKAPEIPLKDYVYNETRYSMLTKTRPEAAEKLLKEAQKDVYQRWKAYAHLAEMPVDQE
ncbi:pyruvate:ferredoxin (flavodoxin) oxidoreductase [bacterium]|nr:pyruvate:ferredoxin (flavodoxin) oxidoreductase [bacterium]RQV98235.1 MAG: pyruvate:ferredoxin (flavodoxin) oxidoreductase [bacterium]